MNHNFIKTKEFKIKLVISIILLILVSVSFFFSSKIENVLGLRVETAPNQVAAAEIENSSYKVHFLDVGQGNCSVVELPDGKTMLIDGGDIFYGEKLYEFLTNLGVTKIDYLIASHADSDHIGGLNFIFDKFEIINIFRPMQIAGTTKTETLSNGNTTSYFEIFEKEDLKPAYLKLGKNKFVEVTSATYREFIKNVYSETYIDDGKSKKSNVIVFYDGLKIEGDDYCLEFFAPLISSDNLELSTITNTKGYVTKTYNKDESNNSSAIMLLTICENKFFFSGDASANIDDEDNEAKYEESDFLNSLTASELEKLSAVDVYLAAHHGSYYSTSEKLIELLSPAFVTVSVGENDFGHPHGETIFRIKNSKNLASDGIILTSEAGDITFSKIDDDFVYVTENRESLEKLLISYPLLAVIIFGLLESIVIFIKPKQKSN